MTQGPTRTLRSRDLDDPRRAPRVAVLGATGLVGREMLRLLEERDFPLSELLPLGSPASGRGRTVVHAGREVEVLPVSREALERADLVLSSAGGAVSREWLPLAAAAGAVCVDNTSAFRLAPGVPLVVPEVNADALAGIRLGGEGAIIANPNCSTIQLVVALEPLRRAFGLERVVVSTDQSISGAGARAVEGFRAASAAVLEGRQPDASVAGLPAFDVLARIGALDEDGHSEEERKMVLETPRILGEAVPVDATCVRVPVFTGHAESVLVQTRRPATLDAIRRELRGAAGLRLLEGETPPTPREVAGHHEVLVGRLRASATLERGVQLWLVADNLLKGAAWNAVQIAEALLA